MADRYRDYGLDRYDMRPSYRGRGPKNYRRSDQRAENLADSCGGVRDVQNQIRVARSDR